MVGNNEDCPVFIQQVQEVPQIFIGINIGIFNEFLIGCYIQTRLKISFFCPVPEYMSHIVYVVNMREDDFHPFFFNGVFQAISLPLCIYFPARLHDFTNHGFLSAQCNHNRLHIIHIFNNFIVKAFWVKQHIAIINVHTVANPHFNAGPIFRHVKDTYRTTYPCCPIFIRNCINHIFHKFIIFHDGQWLFILFFLIDCYCIVNALCIRLQQTNPTFHTICQYNAEFFGAKFGIFPVFCVL